MRKITPKQPEIMISEGMGRPMAKKKADPIYPKFRLDLEHLPEAKKWDIGKEYKLELNLKMVGISISKWDNSVEFEIREVGGKDVGQTKPSGADMEPCDD